MKTVFSMRSMAAPARKTRVEVAPEGIALARIIPQDRGAVNEHHHLDEGKLVEASAIMGQVDGMLKELDPPPEWLLRDVDVQAARLAAVTKRGVG